MTEQETTRRARAWNDDMKFLGVYHTVKYYQADGGKIHCLFGWVPKTFDSVAQFQHAVRKWENEDE